MDYRKIIIMFFWVCALAVVGVVVAEDGAPKKSKKDKSAETKETSVPVAKEGTEFRFSGIVETGFDIIDNVEDGTSSNRMINRGEIEISARPVKNVRAEIGVEYNQRGTTHRAYPADQADADGLTPGGMRYILIGPYITVDKFYAQYNLPGIDGQIRAGIMKKSFGLEERAGTDERYFHARSRINDELDDKHGFLDHDLTIMYRHDIGKDFLRFVGGFSWSVADSNRYFQNYSVQYDMSDDLKFILAAIVRHDALSDERAVSAGIEGVATTFVSSLNAEYRANITSKIKVMTESELTFGTNPVIKLNKAEKNRDAYILGIREQLRFPIEINTKFLRQIIPVIEGAAYWDDLDSERFEAEGRAGLTLGFAKDSKLQLRQSFGARLQTEKSGDRDIERYRYNLQAVVVF